MILAGIDEAGLGPKLGPLVMACAALRVPDNAGARAMDDKGTVKWAATEPEAEGAESEEPIFKDGLDSLPWELLSSVVTRTPPRGQSRAIADKAWSPLLVADSKQAYKKGDLAALERTLLSLLPAGDAPGPASREDLLAALGHEAPLDPHRAWLEEPWHREAFWRVPVSSSAAAVEADRQRVAAACARDRVSPLHAEAVIAAPAWLNRRFVAGRNKAEVGLELLGGRLRALVDALPDAKGHAVAGKAGASPEPLAIVVDKQGGRAYYGTFLQDLWPGVWPRMRCEGTQRSVYDLELDGRSVRIEFRAKADGSAFCVAWASMIAKYLRERCMADLNAYFQARLPGLAPTAGYPGDAPRFLEAIRPVVRREGIDEALLWRTR